MFFIALAVALLCLVSVSISAPLACEELVRPLDQLDLSHLEGRWALAAGGLSHLPNLERFRQRDSAAVNFSRNTSDSAISYTRSIRLENKCTFNTYNISLEGSSFVISGSNFTMTFLYTSCPDCLVLRFDNKAKQLRNVYLLNNTASMEALRRRDSITLYFSNSSGDSTFSFTQINRFGDLCQYLRYNVSVQHNTFNFDVQDHSYLTGSFLYTSCPDCVSCEQYATVFMC
ncbi:putative alpha-1-acid glycoprotein 1-like [Scophthalmus maximus]|uniref:Putative alpha-1-acid glycoprotein 1-like n=1 Tax=Scophthalmus maximus TaxID=52904 RepID=A0A2U9BPI7_SCOMX|nr:putative alpha-1-acid glycoprotein 1-like [Scophthalmus maximus]